MEEVESDDSELLELLEELRLLDSDVLASEDSDEESVGEELELDEVSVVKD